MSFLRKNNTKEKCFQENDLVYTSDNSLGMRWDSLFIRVMRLRFQLSFFWLDLPRFRHFFVDFSKNTWATSNDFYLVNFRISVVLLQ